MYYTLSGKVTSLMGKVEVDRSTLKLANCGFFFGLIVHARTCTHARIHTCMCKVLC